MNALCAVFVPVKHECSNIMVPFSSSVIITTYLGLFSAVISVSVFNFEDSVASDRLSYLTLANTPNAPLPDR